MGRVLTSVVLSLPLIGAYGIFAIGIVLIYRASRMLNLAHGAMAMVPAYLLYAMVGAGLPVYLALPVGIAGGGLLGFVVEKVFVGRLRGQGSTAQTIGTVAALGVMVALVARFYGSASLTAVPVFPRKGVSVGLSTIQVGEFGLFGVLLVVSAGLYLLISKTDLGLMMRGTAESRLAASLMGVNPSRITSFTWILGGSLAALAGILLASVTVLNPYTLSLQVLPAFIAALIGGLGSLPGALIGAAIVGVTQGIVPVLGSVGEWQGAPQLFLALLAIIVMVARGRAMSGADSGDSDARTATTQPQPSRSGAEAKEGSQDSGARRRSARRPLVGAVVIAAIVFPFIPKMPSSVIASGSAAARYTLFAVSLVLLTGWVGQISLGHAALVGVSAYVTGHVVAFLDIPFPLNLPLAAAASALAAGLLGAVALRVRGLYLAVATLVFSWMASEFLFRQDWFVQNGQIPSQILGIKGSLPFFDLTNRRTFYFFIWGVTAMVLMGAANLRDSKTGRAFFALRGSEMAAASLGVDVMRYKLLAFAASGAIAGAAGNLIMTESRVVTPDQFTFSISLFVLAVGVVGGLQSLGGAIASGVLFAALGETFFRVPRLGDFLEITSALLLALTLIAFSGGLASVPGKLEVVFRPLQIFLQRIAQDIARRRGKKRFVRSVRSAPDAPLKPSVLTRLRRTALLRALAGLMSGLGMPFRAASSRFRRKTAAPIDFAGAMAQAASGIASLRAEAAADPSRNGSAKVAEARAKIAQIRPKGSRLDRSPLIQAEKVTVRFGGLVAVNDASLEVREGEIVGLIGPNGAGKTTLFNAIAGYNSPASGTIRLHGVDATKFPVHRRAQLGVARTFQLIQLSSQLSVYQNLLVATHVHNPTGFLSHLIVSAKSVDYERAARARVEQILEVLDLKDIAHQRSADLPFGVLRMVEVARALVTGFRVAMLDEPASGLDNTETDRLMEVLRFVRGLGVTILLIEHDVRMVTGVSDYMYVLDQGEIIAEGTPEKIQRDPSVIAAYLGEPAKEAVG